MSVEVIATILLIGSFGLFIFIKVPIIYAIGLSSVITTLYLDLPLQMVVQNSIMGMSKFSLLAVPFFIFAGEIMSSGGIATRLIDLSNALVGWLRGGLAMVNIVASMFFGGISGSSAADTSSLGSVLIPIMRKQGYDGEFATNVTMASSVQGILIPPSHNMVLYAMVAGSVSIGALFMAGFVPGVLLGVALMIYSYIVAVKRNYPKGDKFELKNVWVSVKRAYLGLLTVLIVVFGVIGGIFTATESAAIASVYAFIITFFVYREIPLKEFWAIVRRTIKTLSIVIILIGVSASFGWLLAYLKVPELVTASIFAVSTNPIVVMMILNVILLLLGTIMDMSAIILIASPVLLPIAVKVGMDPVHFGVVMILNLGIGLITPPVGSTLFIGSAISGISMERLSKTLLPFYGVMFIVLMLITYVPIVVMWLPKLMGY